MDGMELYGSFMPQHENPVTDRITAILQKRAQPIEMTPEQQRYASDAAIAYAAGGKSRGYSDIVRDWRAPQLAAQDREFESEKGAYDMFEMKRQAGDKSLQAIRDQISRITSDPMAQAKIIEAMHNDPEPITPQNALVKAARYVKELGIQPDYARQRMKEDLEIQKTQAEIEKINREPATGTGGTGTGGTGTGVERMRDWYISHGVPPLEAASIAQKSAGLGNVYIPGQGIVPIANSKTLDTLDYSIDSIDRVLNSPGLESRVGYSSYIPAALQGYAAKTAQARIDQLKGMGFMDAYNTLKGGGQITEIEGEKATTAKIRLEQAVSDEDFVEALREWQDLQKQIRDRLRGQLTGNNPPSGTDRPGNRIKYDAQGNRIP